MTTKYSEMNKTNRTMSYICQLRERKSINDLYQCNYDNKASLDLILAHDQFSSFRDQNSQGKGIPSDATNKVIYLSFNFKVPY